MGLMSQSRKVHCIFLQLEIALWVFCRVKTEILIKQIVGESKQKSHRENSFKKKANAI